MIECIISVALISIIITGSSLLFSFAFNSYKHYTDTWQIKHDVHTTLKYIEKNLREFNQKNIIFDSNENIFRGKNYNNDDVLIDLSGEISQVKNTLIYFCRAEKQTRVSKNKEHNVLCDNIGDIIINELIEGRLIEIEVIADKIEYSAKTRLNLNYREN